MRQVRSIALGLLLAAATLAGRATEVGAVCLDTDGDGYFAGWSSRTENLSKTPIDYYAHKAIALDAAGNPTIAWRNGPGVAVTRWSGSAWVKMDGSAGFDQLAHPNLYQQNPTNMLMVLDGASRPHVFWTNYWSGARHYYTRWDGAAWVRMDGAPGVEEITQLLGGAQQPAEVKLALDRNGRPYLVANRVEYLPPGQYQTYVWGIFLTHWDGEKWAAMGGAPGSELISGSATGQSPKLVIDASDKPWVTWEEPSPGGSEISLTRWDGQQWVQADGTPGVENISAGGLAAGRHQIAMAAPDKITLVWNEWRGDYEDPAATTQVHLTRWDGTKWARMDGAAGREVLASYDSPAGISPLLQLGPEGNPVVLWAGPAGLTLTRWSGDAWSRMDGQAGSELVPAGVKALQFTLDSRGWPNIVWQVFTDHNTLRFLHWNGGGWSGMSGGTSELLSYDDRGVNYPLIVAGPGNAPQVVWNGMLRVNNAWRIYVFYAHWNGTRWAPRITDCGTLGDCNDGNPLINPAAAEICADGIDNNCNGRTDTQDEACPQNRAPIANAGPDQAGRPGGSATLDGSMSADPDANYPLRYSWTLVAKPEGSQASLAAADTVNPSFVLDLPGDYLVDLVVTDALGLASPPDQTRVSSVNTAPTAEAGPDQALLLVGSLVQLDGTLSFDPDGDPITWRWEIVSRPPDSQATLTDPGAPAPTFVADRHGDYLVQLTVRDPWVDGAPDTVRVSFQNVRPIAVAGTSRAVLVGDTVQLDGTGSSDANADFLFFQWALVSAPTDSQAAVLDATSPRASFVADRPGLYVVSLVVDDLFEPSDPSNLTVLAITWQDALEESLIALIDAINELPDSSFRNPNNRDTLAKKVSNVLQKVQSGDYRAALEKLENDVMGKFGGCALEGAAGGPDWIVSCEDQRLVDAPAQRAAGLLRGYAF